MRLYIISSTIDFDFIWRKDYFAIIIDLFVQAKSKY